MQVNLIIDALGGSQERAAEALRARGYKIGQTAVSRWVRTGVIPARRIPQIDETAKALGVKLPWKQILGVQ